MPPISYWRKMRTPPPPKTMLTNLTLKPAISVEKNTKDFSNIAISLGDALIFENPN